MKNETFKCCAIAIPLSNRNFFTENEKLSFKHLEMHLGRYDRFLVIPESLQIEIGGYKKVAFEDKYFGSAMAHNKLMLSEHFYKYFQHYEYVLIYHLDSLVFADELMDWCRKGYDYLAPPWIKHENAPYAGNAEYEGKVGNGGFSLRKVEAFLKVLSSKKLSKNPLAVIKSAIKYGASARKYAVVLKLPLYCHHRFNGVISETRQYPHNEDHFWASRAVNYHKEFKVAPVEIALKFAFECVPSYCYELNDRRLPFGCHAWNKYERGFWESFIIQN